MKLLRIVRLGIVLHRVVVLVGTTANNNGRNARSLLIPMKMGIRICLGIMNKKMIMVRRRREEREESESYTG